MSLNNLPRILSEVLSVEVWHDRFRSGKRTVTLHVDVTFREGRMGGEAASPVTFKMALNRAEIIAIVPETEPCKIIPQSVARVGVAGHSDRTETRGSSRQRSVKLGAKSSASFKGGDKNTESQKRKAVSDLQVLHFKTNEGHHGWLIEHANERPLSGKPWDADKHPRLKIKDTRSDIGLLEPQVRIQVLCKREDIAISDIKLKNESWRDKFSDTKRVAVEGFIKERISQIDFELPDDISPDFTEIKMADVIAEYV